MIIGQMSSIKGSKTKEVNNEGIGKHDYYDYSNQTNDNRANQ